MNPTKISNETTHGVVQRERARLAGFGLLMLVAGGALWGVAGPPRLPAQLTTLEQVVKILSGASVPLEPLRLVLVDGAWLLWLWIVGSLCLELGLVAAEAAAGGAEWVRACRQVADRLSLPIVRRAVATAFALQILSRGVSIASAQAIAPAETTLVSDATPPTAWAEPSGADADAPGYLVRAGDTLWSIAERAYGSGTEYRRIIEANLGRQMPDGQLFSAQGVIRPGWQLSLPGAESDFAGGDQPGWYTVRRGDSLSSIAASTLGDGSRWTELFELNRGLLAPDGRHYLTDPDVIWPGLALRLPDASLRPDQPPEALRVEQPGPTDQVAAGAPQVADDSISPAVEPAPAIDPGATDTPPLVRTLHALTPLALEAADVPPVDDQATSPGVEVPASASRAADDVSVPTMPWPAEVPTVPLALGGLGLAGVAGLVFGARRIRRLRPLPRDPETEVVVEGGFAEAHLAHDVTRGLHGVGFDPLGALVGQVVQVLVEFNLGNVHVLAVRHGRSSTTLTLRCGLADQAILVDMAPVFAERLEAEAEAWVSPDQDVLLRLVRLRKTRLLPIADAMQPGPWLVPLGVLYDRQVYSAAWPSVGHVLVVSMPGHGAETILTSLIATLAARRSPEQLRMWMLASRRALPPPLLELPHLARLVDPADASALGDAVSDLRAELARRTAHEPGSDLVVVVPELSSLGGQAAELALLASHAGDLGVRFVCASTLPDEAATNPLAAQFGTRMVLRMQAEEVSVALLGVTDAAFLGGGGRLLLRVDGREPVELYGYQVAAEHLDRLVRVMRSAYSSAPPATSGVGLSGVQSGQPRTPTDRPLAADDVVLPPNTPDSAPSAATASEPSIPAVTSLATEEPLHAGTEPPAPGARASLEEAPPADGTPDVEPRLRPDSHHQPASADVLPPDPPADPTTDILTLRSETALADTQIAPARAPIEVICFGGPRVMCRGQQVWPRQAGGDAKPWELLLYLACQPAEGVARDVAVEALWPEDDDPDDASHRFRQLRYRLRRQLAEVPGAPATEGVCLERGVLRLDPAVVYSDAQEFLTLVRAARLNPGAGSVPDLERARALYTDDLLQGPDARRYAWVDERDASGVMLREHFRRQFQLASLRLAEQYAMTGALRASVDVYRELTEIDPGDERIWQALFRVHAQRGDRLALMREERRMRESLRELAGHDAASDGASFDEPSGETVQEYQRLLSGLRDRDPEAATA